MINWKKAKRYCGEELSAIENYEQAVNDKTQTWDVHHRAEILPCGTYSIKDLKDHGLYYKQPASSLVFMTHDEHLRLHGLNRSEEAMGLLHSPGSNRRRAESNRHPRGKYKIRQSAEERAAMREKLSEARAGNEIAKGRTWVNDGIISLMVYPDEIPSGFKLGRIYRRKA